MKKLILSLVLLNGFVQGIAFASVNPLIDEHFCPGGRIAAKRNIEGPVYEYTCSNGSKFEIPESDLMERI